MLLLAATLLALVPIRPSWFYSDASGHESGTHHGPYTTYARCQDAADSKTTSILLVGIPRRYECKPYLSWEVDSLGQAVLVVATVLLALFTARLFGATKTVADQTGLLAERTNRVALETQELAKKTAEVAKRTQELAQDTVVASKLADQHHQETLMPLLRYVGGVVAAPSGQTDWWVARSTSGPLANVPFAEVENTGQGMARVCKLSVGFGEAIVVGPVGKGERVPVKFEVPFGHQGNDPPKAPWHMTLAYENFVGEVATTEHFGRWDGSPDHSTIYQAPRIADRVKPKSDSH